MAAEKYYKVSLDNDQDFYIDKRYGVIRKVGSGSYGTVISAIDKTTTEFVAIKKCFRIFDRKLLTKRCLREIKLLKHFNGHPNIVGLKDMDIVDLAKFNEIYLVLECCDTTMHDVIHANVPLEPVHYRWFMYQIFSALNYIHSANVLHRDLKPSNILVNENCSIRICDFGMARSLVQDASVGLGSMTHYVVTRWYRAPEIMLSNRSYGKAIDIWSAGCILAELLGKRVLFKGSDYVDQLKRIIAILGLPEDTSFWDQGTTEGVMDYIKQLRNADGDPPATTSIDFQELLPNSSADGIDLLTCLLQLDPSKRLTAAQALQHPYVLEMHDPLDERTCKTDFDFDSFEYIQDEQILRQCIINEFKEIKRATNQPIDTEEGAATEAGVHDLEPIPACYQDSILYPVAETTPDTSPMMTTPRYCMMPKRRYTGSAISTPRSATATEANQHALAAMRQGQGIPAFQDSLCPPVTIMDNQFVGEPEDMDEDDRQAMLSDDSIQIDPHRRLLDPSSADVRALERHLSMDW
ncbi:Pkinase-domain-containing protein [Hesseltinella vesiculosa]|uniref:Mitogen-activated protein kinase n=1 Tax=Hesseltinella vesiculosa TaxID=101127 RepID=A0A1X2GB44_9FUNG|nr:Pkinase-domain-containing protein [Hesseltinella vesiculosa]